MSGKTLDYQDLMKAATKNAYYGNKQASKQIFPNLAKKIDPKQEKLNFGVQKFLAQKKQEEEKKLAEENAKRDKLLAVRNNDRKQKKKVAAMLRMTKSANKACVADAAHCLEQSASNLEMVQCDDDDYGYESEFAKKFHQQMMQKFSQSSQNIQRADNSKISLANKTSTRSEISANKQAISSSSFSSDSSNEIKKSISYSQKAKPRRPPPPVQSYGELLQMAEQCSKAQKQSAPILPPIPKPREGEFEFGRPMTAKEKAEYLQEKEMKDRIQKGLVNPIIQSGRPDRSTSGSGNKSVVPPKETKVSNTKELTSKNPKLLKPQQSIRPLPTPESDSHTIKQARPGPPDRRSDVSPTPRTFSTGSDSQKRHLDNRRDHGANRQQRSQNSQNAPASSVSFRTSNEISKEKIQSKPNKEMQIKVEKEYKLSNSNPVAGKEILREKDQKRAMERRRESPRPTSPHRNQGHSRPNPSRHGNELQRKRPSRPNPQTHLKRRNVIDSDEYDSEMDDFIDDSDAPGGGSISDVIGQLFNYNRHRYADESSGDDECMESSYMQQLKEERYSAREGLREDLEEERKEREEEERRQKRKLMMKRR